jgi:hypothetical protein
MVKARVKPKAKPKPKAKEAKMWTKPKYEKKPTAKTVERAKPQAPTPKPAPVAPKPKAQAPVKAEKSTPFEPTPVTVHEVTSLEPWRCVWCGNVETVDAHMCGRCGQMR